MKSSMQTESNITTSNLEDTLRIHVNQFYLEKYLDHPQIDDIEYDRLAKIYEAETGKSVKSLIEWDPDLTFEHEPIEALEKTQVIDNDLQKAISEYQNNFESDQTQEYYLNYKYDGCSIKAYYKDGKLTKILGTPDEETGIIRTKAFMSLFPEKVNSSITALQGEVLVDANVYGKLARNAANGLTNSKYKDEEVASEAFIRIYKVSYSEDWSFERQLEDLESLPQIVIERERPIEYGGDPVKVRDLVFSAAELVGISDAPTESIITECPYYMISIEKDIDCQPVKFQVDGVVLYHTDGIHGFKFYYTESAITTVKDVVWNKQSNGSYAAVLMLEPVTLEDKYIQKCSSNGVPKMVEEEYGKGAEVRVILANTTIPKIIEVIKPSTDFNYPKCECGYQLSYDDLFGSTLKCGNKGVCTDKVSKFHPEVCQWLVDEQLFDQLTTVEECITKCPEWFAYAFHIDRWDPFDKIKDVDKDVMARELSQAIISNDPAVMDNWMDTHFRLSELQWNNYEVNRGSGIEVLRMLLAENEISNIKDFLTEYYS